MKKLIMLVVVAVLAGAVHAASVQTITIGSLTSATGTWVNTITPKRDVVVKSAFIQCAATATNETFTAKVSNDGVYFTVDNSGPITGTVAYIDFAIPVMCKYGQTVTVSRTTAYTNTTAIMLGVE